MSADVITAVPLPFIDQHKVSIAVRAPANRKLMVPSFGCLPVRRGWGERVVKESCDNDDEEIIINNPLSSSPCISPSPELLLLLLLNHSPPRHFNLPSSNTTSYSSFTSFSPTCASLTLNLLLPRTSPPPLTPSPPTPAPPPYQKEGHSGAQDEAGHHVRAVVPVLGDPVQSGEEGRAERAQAEDGLGQPA